MTRSSIVMAVVVQVRTAETDDFTGLEALAPIVAAVGEHGAARGIARDAPHT